LIFAPVSKFTYFIFQKYIPIVYLALLYSVLVISGLINDPAPLETLMRPTLPAIRDMFGTNYGAAAGWVHFLCFDLFVGYFIRNQAIKRGHSFKWVSPLLFVSLMIPPFGWLVFESTSYFLRKKNEQ
jgi:hypothetical protein